MSSYSNQTPMALEIEQQRQYQCLCIVLQAVNETCKRMGDNSTSFGSTCSDAPLTDFQKALCKLAQTLDSEKGGNCVTALAVLKGLRGPEFVFASNSRKVPELETTKVFLSELIEYVGSYADKSLDKNATKAVQKQVLTRILKFNFPRLEEDLKGLNAALECCIAFCEDPQQPSRLSDVTQLRTLKDRAQFPRDITASPNAEKKFLRDCEDLLKAIQRCRDDQIDNTFEKYIGNVDPEYSYQWYQLRHHLGRLHSLRQASETLVQACKEWPSLFKDFTVSYIKSSLFRKFSHPRMLPGSAMEIIQTAFPEHNVSHYESDIADLRNHGLDEQIQKKQQEFPSKTQVHCEVNLHNHLMKTGKNRPCDLWNDVMFIATSKPPCRLCSYYFEDSENNFQVQPPHMNLYPKWQLPDVLDPNDEASIESRRELMEDIFEHMQDCVLQMLQRKSPEGRRYDSRTDSRNWPASVRDGADSRSPVGGHNMHPGFQVTDEDLYDVLEMGNDGVGLAVFQ
ncbi:hypothetical protein BKA59DRAFT_559904 [Fusarium tricinctum]|uniref:Uncharacterized protein n=1 Tax=Fusarium tricinctum TaxID=61284 RepID=A0A8K0W663_9HYPO|nr:hypothetical protein BKA59DRAFT_559904 [Fusarium tricinctum]